MFLAELRKLLSWWVPIVLLVGVLFALFTVNYLFHPVSVETEQVIYPQNAQQREKLDELYDLVQEMLKQDREEVIRSSRYMNRYEYEHFYKLEDGLCEMIRQDDAMAVYRELLPLQVTVKRVENRAYPVEFSDEQALAYHRVRTMAGDVSAVVLMWMVLPVMFFCRDFTLRIGNGPICRGKRRSRVFLCRIAAYCLLALLICAIQLGIGLTMTYRSADMSLVPTSYVLRCVVNNLTLNVLSLLVPIWIPFLLQSYLASAPCVIAFTFLIWKLDISIGHFFFGAFDHTALWEITLRPAAVLLEMGSFLILPVLSVAVSALIFCRRDWK